MTVNDVIIRDIKICSSDKTTTENTYTTKGMLIVGWHMVIYYDTTAGGGVTPAVNLINYNKGECGIG